jgi:FkbM family methyltransferase
MSLKGRFNVLYERKLRARELGFRFKRAAGFILPGVIQVGGVPLNLSLPGDSGSLTAFVDILLDDCYLLRQFPDDVKTVIDIGGHVGLFAIAARNRWPTAIIHSYEPNEALRAHWERHAAQTDFVVYDEAVADRPARAELISNNESVQVRIVETPQGPIRQTAFRDVISRAGSQVDLVKLDCEGSEWSILRDHEAWERVRFLTMEFHLWAGYSLEDLKSRISHLGFRISHLQESGTDFGILAAYR